MALGLSEPGAEASPTPPEPVPTASLVTRGASWMLAAQVAGQVTSVVSLLALGALLPPQAFGTVAAGIVLITVGTLLMGAGTLGSIVSAREIDDREARRALFLNVASGVILAAAIAVVAEPMTSTFAKGGDPNVLRALGASLLLNSFTIVPTALLQKRMRFRGYAIATVTATVISHLFAVAAAVLGAGVWALVLRQVLYYGVLAVVAWWLARDLLAALRHRAAAPEPRPQRRVAPWFFLLSAAHVVALNSDYLAVGKLTGASQLGAYSLAFTLSFVPLRQFAWQIGGVLFAASAAEHDRARVGRQMIRALQVSAVVLLPAVVPAVTLAPWVLPGVLGDEWGDMVVPFQVLVCVGVGHALLNVIGEFLSGTGNVAFRARVSVVWALAMVGTLLVLVPPFGIRGAAMAHAVLFVPLAVTLAVGGSRRLGLDPRRVISSLRDVVVPVAAQGLATVAAVATLVRLGVHPYAADVAGVALGVGVVGVMLVRRQSSPLEDALAVISASFRRRAPRQATGDATPRH